MRKSCAKTVASLCQFGGKSAGVCAHGGLCAPARVHKLGGFKPVLRLFSTGFSAGLFSRFYLSNACFYTLSTPLTTNKTI